MQKIVCCRIDDRLIHGQVAAVWTKYVKQTRIVVVDDEANQDDLQKQMLRLACPAGIKLSVLSVVKTLNNFNEGKYDNDLIMLIVRNPKSIVELIKHDFKWLPQEIVVGNISARPDKRQIHKGINVNQEDVDNFNFMVSKGYSPYCQLLPQDEKKLITRLI